VVEGRNQSPVAFAAAATEQLILEKQLQATDMLLQVNKFLIQKSLHLFGVWALLVFFRMWTSLRVVKDWGASPFLFD
jgi:hypothetical protein